MNRNLFCTAVVDDKGHTDGGDFKADAAYKDDNRYLVNFVIGSSDAGWQRFDLP